MTDQVLPAPEAVPATVTGNDAAPGTLTAPGFRFHPTDEELICYYLKRKVQGKPMRLDVIGEVDVYKHEPSELPAFEAENKGPRMVLLQYPGKEVQTRCFYKPSNKGRLLEENSRRQGNPRDGKSIGIVKSLLFHKGRAPKRQPTNWVIHEYRLVDDGQGLEMDAYVLCRVFRKQHFGPSSRVMYAPFSEQDRDDDGGRAPVSSLVHAIGINEKIQQENHAQSMNLIDLNELLKEPVATMVPTSSSTELIKDLQKEKQEMAVERETHNLDMMNAEAMISLLRGKIDELRAENEELKEEEHQQEKMLLNGHNKKGAKFWCLLFFSFSCTSLAYISMECSERLS